MSSLAGFWREFQPSSDNIHPCDRDHFVDRPCPRKFWTDRTLLPQPYLGDLSRADIFVVYANPGIGEDDPHWEAQPDFRRARMATIRQEWRPSDYRFEFFDPRICDHSGFGWRRQKLGATKSEALLNRFAAIEFYPYHSERYGRATARYALSSFAAVGMSSRHPPVRTSSLIGAATATHVVDHCAQTHRAGLPSITG